MTELRTRDIPLNWDVDESWLPRIEPKAGTMRAPLVADLVERERELIEDALRKSAGTVSGRTGAAAKLGIPRQTLESKIRKVGIDRHRFRAVQSRCWTLVVHAEGSANAEPSARPPPSTPVMHGNGRGTVVAMGSRIDAVRSVEPMPRRSS